MIVRDSPIRASGTRAGRPACGGALKSSIRQWKNIDRHGALPYCFLEIIVQIEAKGMARKGKLVEAVAYMRTSSRLTSGRAKTARNANVLPSRPMQRLPAIPTPVR